jgi:phage terminase large subunit
VKVVIPYAPRKIQEALHNSTERFKVVVAHRRFGKTVFAINHLLRAALLDTRRAARYAYIAPLRSQAKSIAWDLLKHYASTIPGVSFNEAELRCDLPNGARITLYGADNPDSLRGLYFMGAVLDEYGDMKSRMWTEICRPALSDHKGFAIFIGTPKGKNQFYRLYEYSQGDDPEWSNHLFRASETGYVDAGELMSARRAMSANRFAQEFECSFDAAIEGAVYSSEFQQIDADNRISGVPVEAGTEVHTAWDLGWSDSTSIVFFQLAGREIHIVDYYEVSGANIGELAKVVKAKGYNFGSHYMPHDVAVHEQGTGKSREQMYIEAGITPIVTVKRPKLKSDGIEATRKILSRCWFDKERTKDLTEALRLYRYEVDEKMSTEERRMFRLNPVHDWTSHASDAMQTMALGFDEPTSDWSKPIKVDVSWVV